MSAQAIEEAVRRRLSPKKPHVCHPQCSPSGAMMRCVCGKDVRN